MSDELQKGYRPPEASQQQGIPELQRPSAQAAEIHNLQERGIEVGEQTLKIGDQISVRRSDGSVEADWLVRSFGVNKVVAEKTTPEGELLRKVYTTDQFQAEQQGFRPPAHEAQQARNNVHLAGERLREQAERSGIDTNKPGWEKVFDSFIRGASGL